MKRKKWKRCVICGENFWCEEGVELEGAALWICQLSTVKLHWHLLPNWLGVMEYFVDWSKFLMVIDQTSIIHWHPLKKAARSWQLAGNYMYLTRSVRKWIELVNHSGHKHTTFHSIVQCLLLQLDRLLLDFQQQILPVLSLVMKQLSV